MKYKSVMITRRGGPEVLTVTENELREPAGKEVRIKIMACGVGGTDIAMRYRNYLFAPRIPFVPGYEIVGVVDAIGKEVKEMKPGERVGALSVYGGYAEFIYLEEEHLVSVPEGLDPGEAVSVILNYTTAWQMMKRVAKVKSGDKVLITGASGGVGTALMDIGKMEDLILYGTASVNKHKALENFNATLIDHKSEDFEKVICDKEPGGLDFVFDGFGVENIRRSFRILKKGGMLVEYAFPFRGTGYFLRYVAGIFSANFRGKKGKSYGISMNYKLNKKPVLEDISHMFELLKENRISLLISARLPLQEAAEANQLLEKGEVAGKIILVTPELL